MCQLSVHDEPDTVYIHLPDLMHIFVWCVARLQRHVQHPNCETSRWFTCKHTKHFSIPMCSISFPHINININIYMSCSWFLSLSISCSCSPEIENKVTFKSTPSSAGVMKGKSGWLLWLLYVIVTSGPLSEEKKWRCWMTAGPSLIVNIIERLWQVNVSVTQGTKHPHYLSLAFLFITQMQTSFVFMMMMQSFHILQLKTDLLFDRLMKYICVKMHRAQPAWSINDSICNNPGISDNNSVFAAICVLKMCPLCIHYVCMWQCVGLEAPSGPGV